MATIRPKRIIDLSPRPHQHFSTRHHVSVLPGTGDENYKFPPDLAERALARKEAILPPTARPARKRSRKTSKVDTTAAKRDAESLGILFTTGKLHIMGIVKEHVAKVESGEIDTDADYRALVNGASLIQGLMLKRQFDGALEGFFGNMDSVAEQAIEKMPVKYTKALTDHQRQLNLLRGQVNDAFPKVLQGLVEKNPSVPVHALMDHAVELIAQELRPILDVLALYTTTLQQYTSGKFSKMLHGINAYMESCFRVSPELPLSTFKVGDVVLSGFVGSGLGTIPAGKGALHLHLLLVQIDMQDWTAPAIPLLGHEWQHQAFADIPGLAEETTAKLAANSRTAVSSGTVKLSTEKSRIGRNTVPTVDLIVKWFTDCIGEKDADGNGGVRLHGPAFLYTFMYSFPAMLVRGGAIKDAKRLLRTGSVYTLHDAGNGKSVLEFEPHPPDWIRAHIVAACLDEIGWSKVASRLRKLADRIVGETPEFVTWEDAEGKSSTVIKISAKDIQALAPTIAKTLLSEPMDSLHGKAWRDIWVFDEKAQAVVDEVCEVLLKGGTELRKDLEALPIHIGSAAAQAFWIASYDGEPSDALAKLQENAFNMIIEARNRMPA